MVLETLAPAERVALVLHDMFDLPFDDIAPVVGTLPSRSKAARKSRTRRVKGASGDPEADPVRQREVVDASLAASRGGDFAALLAVLDPDVVPHADRTAVQAATARPDKGAPKLAPKFRGAAAVADAFSGRAGSAQPALVDGAVGAVWAP